MKLTHRVTFTDDPTPSFYEIRGDRLANGFYIQDGFLVIMQNGKKTYIPAHRIREAVELEDVS